MRDKIYLSEVADIIMGQSPDSSSCNTIGLGLPFLQGCGEFGKKHPIVKNYCTQPRKISPENSILISVRAPVGDINLANQDFVIGRGLAGVVARNVDRKFLYYSILQNKKQLERVSQGSTFKAINTNNLHEFEIVLFHNNEQKKIAKILSTVDNVIEKTESAIAKYQAIKQGLMHDLFELKSNDYWDFYELGDIANIIDPHPSHRAPAIDDRGIPFIGIGDIDESGNLIKNARKVSEKIFDEHSLRYKLNDKIIGFGRVATIGKIIRFKKYDFKFTVSPTMAIIHPNKIESDYLAFALDSDNIKNQIDKLLTGSTRSSLGIELLRKLLIKIPKSDSEKIKISKMLNTIVTSIETEQQALAKYQQLKAGLLQDLLTGKVDVSVD